ncbi:hypothetical protein [Planococcus halotolerans]|uniref:hypothetical protein n=1 Tax=Planococcus halotolerans TaxID=2233542 RepID=UPI0010928E80|nr:hypothetical protein [Planococcus halotolerans]QHJ69877.1 hypothetical protein DNR44_004345 [Planococcus halotolerans]
MKLFTAILLSMILGYLLLFFGAFVGGLLAFGIVLGVLIRGLMLLDDIHKIITGKKPKKSALDEYLEERNRKEKAADFKM